MAEWFKAHAWKACVGNTTVGSNPTLSASFFPRNFFLRVGWSPRLVSASCETIDCHFGPGGRARAGNLDRFRGENRDRTVASHHAGHSGLRRADARTVEESRRARTE